MSDTPSSEEPDDEASPPIQVTGAPDEIWLVYGDLSDLVEDTSHAECCRSGEVTWCEDQQFSTDVRYVRADLAAAACTLAAANYTETVSADPGTQDGEAARLRAALVEVRDRLKRHPMYADLSEQEEIEVGGEAAELSYLVRLASEALGQ